MLGFILSNLAWFATRDWRRFGVLQRIGLVYGARCYFLAAGPRIRLALIAVLLRGAGQRRQTSFRYACCTGASASSSRMPTANEAALLAAAAHGRSLAPAASTPYRA